MKTILKALAAALAIAAAATSVTSCQTTAKEAKTAEIPLPEHPRPDFQRQDFINLNGYWSFTYSDSLAALGLESYDKKILVPFPWGSKLSEVKDEDYDIAYYGREIRVPRKWAGRRIFLVIGASDWETTAFIDGKELGSHQGGYTPFEFEITDYVTPGKKNEIKLTIDDTYSVTRPYGKQGYGDARGIWQTAYLEARGSQYISSLHFSPDIDNEKVHVDITLADDPEPGTNVALTFKNGEYTTVSVPATGRTTSFDVDMPGQHLWSLDDPYLYEVTAIVGKGRRTVDWVDSYFGQRKISTMQVPGQDYRYVALNNEPIYLKLCLDQSYNPEGFYTFPSDEYMKNEILLSKKMGLNGNRVHVKVEVPRKLYWADKLGLLIMADVPNYWGEPTQEAKENWEGTMRAEIERDYNHPCIFEWVNFNETWGLFDDQPVNNPYTGTYRPETKEWVLSMYNLAKSLDPTRLVEDNSACKYDHLKTDINSWHQYRPSYAWEDSIARYDRCAYPGSHQNFAAGHVQNGEPLLNAECGNVWGYEGSAGDCDYVFDYHEMMNAFHRHPKVAGWLYTEHHDVFCEWNGYVKYDRTRKIDGLDEYVPDMTVADFQTDYYMTTMVPVCQQVPAGSAQTLDLYSSFTTAKDPGAITLETTLIGWDDLGEKHEYGTETCQIEFKPFQLAFAHQRKVEIPRANGLYALSYVLKNAEGTAISRNFSLYIVKDGPARTDAVTFSPKSYTAKEWSVKESDILDGLKVDGFGSGYFEYSVNIPSGMDVETKDAELIFEASAKQQFYKDVEGEEARRQYLNGRKCDHCESPNSYAMTDDELFTSKVQVSINGKDLGTYDLADDPADERGALSWFAQPHNLHLYEAGSYGYIVKVRIPAGTMKSGEAATVRFTVPSDAVSDKSGGLAIYGKDFGHYPLDPTIKAD